MDLRMCLPNFLIRNHLKGFYWVFKVEPITGFSDNVVHVFFSLIIRIIYDNMLRNININGGT